MKKILMASNINLHICVNEHINDYVPFFEKFFRTIGHHCGSSHRHDKNSLLIYSGFPPYGLNCSNCSQTESSINISRVSASPIGDCFFENVFKNIPCGRLLDITYDNRLIGKYCKKNNILATTDIAHTGGNGPHIEKIFNDLLELKILKIKSKIKPKTKNVKITLGADPEFETKVDNKDVSAYDLVSIMTRNKSIISHDGRTQPQRELRPDPANTPSELVENIRDLIRISSFFKEELYVVGDRMPLGGHIHIGNVTPCSDMVTALDYFSFPFLKFNSKIRRDSPYGKPGDIRSKEYGFEYRTLPSVWLATPLLATMTLELIKSIVEQMINGKEIIITDKFQRESYKEDLMSLGFSDEWCKIFADEIRNLKTNMYIPLSESWDCEIPKKYQVSKIYMSSPDVLSPRVVSYELEE